MEHNASAGTDVLGGANAAAGTGADLAPQETSAEEKAKAFRALIRGEYRAQYAEETQKLINRRFKETEKLRQRVKELEAQADGSAGGASPAPTVRDEPPEEAGETPQSLRDSSPVRGAQ